MSGDLQQIKKQNDQSAKNKGMSGTSGASYTISSSDVSRLQQIKQANDQSAQSSGMNASSSTSTSATSFSNMAGDPGIQEAKQLNQKSRDNKGTHNR